MYSIAITPILAACWAGRLTDPAVKCPAKASVISVDGPLGLLELAATFFFPASRPLTSVRVVPLADTTVDEHGTPLARKTADSVGPLPNKSPVPEVPSGE